MHPRTVATFEQLEAAEWFAHVGTWTGIHDREKVILLATWQEAIEHCGSLEWENLCLEAANQYRERLNEQSPARFHQWNEVVASLKPLTGPFVRNKVERVVREYDLPKVFEDTVRWDILHLCMEAEYADVYPPGFYASQAYWYLNGHFPCGWEGDFPSGKLVLF